LYSIAVNLFGLGNQIDMCIEEMSELTKELLKFKRGKDNIEQICEEIADVEITIEQMKLTFDKENKVNKYTQEKLIRLENRINNHQMKNLGQWIQDVTK
jgi:DNA-directed RNA polymerase sigma subunit (sigma70/sigma32)